MNISHLKVFINLAETLNFSLTAKAMNLTQSAVSQAIKSIEIELGFSLFKRTKRQVSLTKSGALFYRRVTTVLSNFDKAVIDSREVYQREKSTLTIGTTGTSFESHALPLMIKNYRKAYPDVKIYLEYFNHNRLKQHLLNKECDLIFTTQDDLYDTPKIAFTKLVGGYFCALVPVGNELSQRSELPLDSFEQQNLILLNDNLCPPEQLKLQRLLQNSYPDLETTFVDNVAVANTMVEAGLGITVMPNFISCTNRQLFKMIPLDYSVDLVYGTGTLVQLPSDAASDFTRWLVKYDTFA
ncbi:LysR family transcriptional regulator [Lactiplantibacillus pentosus]|uniref:LysR family transcriptional regulator n=1 Tax=Lactiplantibacillus pentosus TaxID=1589 RepID=UPI001C1FD096|nr:LysR family transcriptional regulator [Lactiplantibacillus pentosus]MBU7503642.1 LysR family transcriptional regulator [Lactiplantibacillus pentosus]MDY1546277.1 LysR family transcriptional regulator [Lactiplantibacillus pentosus]